MTLTRTSSRLVGKIENSENESSVSMPLVPRSMTRLRPPVRFSEVEAQAEGMDVLEGLDRDSRTARKATLAKMASRSWAKPCIMMRPTP
jgi:hypothetical protein